jgi:hypothetical protein
VSLAGDSRRPTAYAPSPRQRGAGRITGRGSEADRRRRSALRRIPNRANRVALRARTQDCAPSVARHGRQRLRSGVPHEAWTRLAVCSAAGLVLQLDGTLVTVALPSVAHELRVSVSSSAALLSAYFAAYALLLVPGGMFVDRFGVRRVAVGGSVYSWPGRRRERSPVASGC